MIAFTNPSVPPAYLRTWDVGKSVSQDRDPDESDFVTTLLAMAGYDLRQPSQRIASAHDILGTMLCSAEQQHALVQAADATARLARMLGQLIEVLQLHERPCEGLRLPVLVGPILDHVTAEFDERARRKEITLEVTSTGGAALSHPLLLTSILRNLIRNAIDYTPRGGSVFVSSHRRGPELCLYVRDTGSGIRPDALSKIFEALRMAERGRADGLGLGLFMVERAADLLGHRIEVRSAKGRGSVFTIKTRSFSTRRRGPHCRFPGGPAVAMQ
jgi:signal transduction histidine kinase